MKERAVNRRRFFKLLGLGAVAGAGIGAGTRFGWGSERPRESPSQPHEEHDGEGAPEISPTLHRESIARRGEGGLFEGFPGPAGSRGQLDTLLYPPPAEPARAGGIRSYELTTMPKTIEIAKNTFFDAWTFNGTVPGPVLRATQGDLLRVRLRNRMPHPHSIHFHGVHPANMDGVFEAVLPGRDFSYEFVAEPFGLFPYHCHMDPLDQHITRGLYGTLIIDPPQPRLPAKELVMVMNGYDLNFDGENEIYSVNGIGNYHVLFPIPLKVGELVRIYLVNMTEFDPLNSLHLHANMFRVYPSGTSLEPAALTDIVNLGIAERSIVEFAYATPGRYMFHAHQSEINLRGWMGFFDVRA